MDVSQPAIGGKAPRRKWVWAGVVLVALAGLYSAGWYIAASKVRDQLLAALTGQDANDLSVDCRNAKMGGFPFSMALSCTGLAADDVEHGISTTLGPGEARVSLLAPNSVHSALKGPVEIRSARGMLVSEWQALTTDIDFGLHGMQSLRVDSSGLKANFTDPAKGNALQALSDKLLAFADGSSGDLSLGLLMEGARISRNGNALPLPPLKLDAALKVVERGDLVGRFDRAALYGARGTIERLTANLGEGRDISLTGPFAVDAQGRISGKFQLEARNIQSWLDAARQTIPEAEAIIDTAASLIRSYTKGQPDLSIDLTLKRGKVLIAGFIPVGEVPPL